VRTLQDFRFGNKSRYVGNTDNVQIAAFNGSTRLNSSVMVRIRKIGTLYIFVETFREFRFGQKSRNIATLNMHYVVVLGGDVRLTLKALVCLGFGVIKI
jgi:hypothetical protein